MRQAIEVVGRIAPLDDEAAAALAERLVPRTIARSGYLLREGRVCDFVGFVVAGALVYAKRGTDRARRTIDFALEGDWVADNRSRLDGTPSDIAIQAIETTELLLLRHRDLEELYAKHPRLERLGRVLMERAYLRMVEQSIDLQLLPARERYANLLDKSPHVLRRFPLYHVASYLGIAPKSLSRIRGGRS